MIDNGILYLLNQLSQRSLEWDVIIVSDHGMTNTSKDRIIYLDDIIDVSQITIFGAGPFMMIYPKNPSGNIVKLRLDNDLFYEKLYQSKANLSVWNSSTLPKEYHFDYKSRIGPIVVQAHSGFVITTRSEYNGTGEYPWPLGFHGYPLDDVDMHAMFLAYGPSFKKGKQIEAFSNVEIYQLISHLLGITPSSHDGTIDWMDRMKTLLN